MPHLGLGTGSRQSPAVGTDLGPLHRGHFAAPLPRTQHDLVEVAEGIAEPGERRPQNRDLLGTQNSLAILLLTRTLQAHGRRRLDDLLIDSPVEYLADQSQQAVRSDPTVACLLPQPFLDVAAGDLADRAIVPGNKLYIDLALHLFARAVTVREVPHEVCGNRAEGSLLLALLPDLRRNADLCIGNDLHSLRSCLYETDRGERWLDGKAAELAVDPSRDHEALVAAAADADAEARQQPVPIVNLARLR